MLFISPIPPCLKLPATPPVKVCNYYPLIPLQKSLTICNYAKMLTCKFCVNNGLKTSNVFLLFFKKSFLSRIRESDDWWGASSYLLLKLRESNGATLHKSCHHLIAQTCQNFNFIITSRNEMQNVVLNG